MTNQILKIFKSRINTAIFLLLILVLCGVVGFKVISGLSWTDSIYMTVITITPVGYTDVEALDHQAKIFIIGLILASAIILGYALKVISEYIISKNDIKESKQKKQNRFLKCCELSSSELFLFYFAGRKCLSKFESRCIYVTKHRNRIKKVSSWIY